MDRLQRWFDSRGWSPFAFQRRCWEAYLQGRSGLLHAPTGMGKTYAVWLGPAAEALAERDALSEGATGREPSSGGDRCRTADSARAPKSSASPVRASGAVRDRPSHDPLRVLWLTPLRALAGDTVEALRLPVRDLGLPWLIEPRTGDTSSSVKSRQRRNLPTALVTTPESLSILLSSADSAELLAGVRCTIVDEWHELMSTKRGVMAELCLARLRAINPQMRTWGLSATLGNIEQAARTLAGPRAETPAIISGKAPKKIAVESIVPQSIERFPWAGHLGIKLLQPVLEKIRSAGTTLLFTNTRSQAEIWFREILRNAPDLLGAVAIHHGSLDRDIRETVEDLLRRRDGLRCVVCTSSLDLGVDFGPVDQVIQVGSPKGVARMIQRAGRSGHRPGAVSRIVCVPSNAFELVEFAAARDAIEKRDLEHRAPVAKPLDVLAQHLVTCAVGGGFVAEELREEVRSTAAYAELTDAEWQWTMDFVHRGGPALTAYPRYTRVIEKDGRWTVASPQLARLHKIAIGTIVADSALKVQYVGGKVLGTIEESFITRLRIGDRFVFAGRVLELKRIRHMTAYVSRARSARGAVPRWNGGRMPLSTQLADAVCARLARADAGDYTVPEMLAMRPLLELQKRLSRIPRPGQLLIELNQTRHGHHVFCYTFAGRLANEGLGALLGLRLSRAAPRSIVAVANDYGIELSADDPLELDEQSWRDLLSPLNLVDDLMEAVTASRLARRQFREIARIAGLTHQGYPGQHTPARQLQASAEMFFDVFEQFDPGNMLLAQSRREVVEGQLEIRRIAEAMQRMLASEMIILRPRTLSPLAFPLFAENLRATTVSSEQWEQRLRKIVAQMERELAEIAADTAEAPEVAAA